MVIQWEVANLMLQQLQLKNWWKSKIVFCKVIFFPWIYLFPSPVFIELKTVKLSINKLILHAKFARTLPSRVVWLRPCQDYIRSWNMRKYEDGVQSFIKIRWKIWVLTSTYNIWGVRPPPPPSGVSGCAPAKIITYSENIVQMKIAY